MSDYIMDMRRCLEESKREYTIEDPRITDLIGEERSREYRYESEHYPNVYLEDAKVGDHFYIYDSADGYMTSQHYWLEIEITHIYGGVYFYKILDRPTVDPNWEGERHFVEGSMLALRNIFPKKVVIVEGFEFTCECPRVEFVVDPNMSNTYSSTYEIKEERRY